MTATTPNRARIQMGRSFIPVIHNHDPFILVEGPRGTLKTITHLNILMMRAAQYPGLKWYIWRSTRSLLSTTVLPSFEKYVVPVWNQVEGMRLTNPNARPAQRSEYIFENGSVFYPVGLDDVLRGTSSEGAGGYLAEAIELENRDQATALAGMMREPGIPFHSIIVDVNPGPPGHWTNHTAEPCSDAIRRVETPADYERLQAYNCRPARDPEKHWKRIVTKIIDNPYFFDTSRWEYTEAGAEYMKNLGVLSGHLRARWIDGVWQAAAGSVFPEFREDVHVINPFPVPASWPVFLGIDFGYDHPCAVLWLTIGPAGTVYVIDEIHRSGMDIPTVAAEIRERNKNRNIVERFADPRDGWKHTQGQPTPLSQQLAAQGLGLFVKWPAAQKEAKNAQVENVRRYLVEGRLKVFRNCPMTVQEFQSWSFKRDTKGNMLVGDDQYEDRNNDAMDVLMGMLAGGVEQRSHAHLAGVPEIRGAGVELIQIRRR
jgi:hypothetical protein